MMVVEYTQRLSLKNRDVLVSTDLNVLFSANLSNSLKFTLKARTLHNLPNKLFFMGFKNETALSTKAFKITLKDIFIGYLPGQIAKLGIGLADFNSFNLYYYAELTNFETIDYAVSKQVEISMSDPLVSATSVTYYFKFQSSKDISSSGKIEITFPSDFSSVHSSFNADTSCSGLRASNTANGLTESYSTGSRILTISGFMAFRPDVPIIIMCSGLKNPTTLPVSPYRTGTFRLDIF